MRGLITLILMAVALGSAAQTADVTVMSYNIRNGNGMDGRCDLRRVAEVIKSVCPDVVALQEVDSMTGRSGNVDVMGELARLTGLHPYYAPAIDYDGGKYGIGLLSRQQPLSLRLEPLPGREEARTLFVADFTHFTFVGTHLSLTGDDRIASLKIINAITDTCSRPVFVAGDFNDNPGSEFMRSVSEKYRVLTCPENPTYPSDTPEETLDYIITPKDVAPEIKVRWAKVIADTIASDHRPVAIGLSLLGRFR